ncbi:helix-turn-helix domain-containing protein [Streptomyces sp. NPDC049879]|uniref:helix-turn-helix domain-containing protein n=1 Tax=Streptomyces sp. NPDC049879 TaxID=3365598 RepID=UPI0037B107EE
MVLVVVLVVVLGAGWRRGERPGRGNGDGGVRGGQDDGMDRPRLTIREAADACGVSPSTIRRRRERGDLPGAVLDPARGWLVPVEDLLAAGLRLHAPAPADAEPGTAGAVPGGASAGAGAEVVAELRARLAEAEAARRVAEVEAEGLREAVRRADAHLADVRRALLALTPAPPAEDGDAPGAARPAVPPQAAPGGAGGPGDAQDGERRGSGRWWRRR